MNNEKPIIVGLDIGTTKIAVIAGRKNEFGKLEILGFGKASSSGVKHGQVLNIDETIKAVRTALDNCFASNPNLDIKEVYVGVAGHHIKSLQTRGDIVRQDTDGEITQKEIDQLAALLPQASISNYTLFERTPPIHHKPGKQRGKAVRVKYTVPVVFRLQS